MTEVQYPVELAVLVWLFAGGASVSASVALLRAGRRPSVTVWTELPRALGVLAMLAGVFGLALVTERTFALGVVFWRDGTGAIGHASLLAFVGAVACGLGLVASWSQEALAARRRAGEAEDR